MSDEQLARVLTGAKIVQAVTAIGAALFAIAWLVRQDSAQQHAREALDYASDLERQLRVREGQVADLENELERAYTPEHEKPDAPAVPCSDCRLLSMCEEKGACQLHAQAHKPRFTVEPNA